MHESQANRQVIAARVGAKPLAPHRPTTLGTNPAMRVERVKAPVGAIHNRKAIKGTGAQKNALGRTSEWNRSPYAPKGGWR